MFEQASIDTRGMLRSPWAITASVAAQTVVVGAVGLISLLQIEALPKVLIMARDAAPRSSIKLADTPRGTVAARPAHLVLRPFSEPSTISPLRLNKAPDAASFVIDEPLAIGFIGVPGAGGGNGGENLLRDGLATFRPPPPPVVAARPRETPVQTVQSGPVHVSKGVQEAKLVHQVKPLYPILARQARISGTVRLVAIIGLDSAIQNLQVASGHPLLTTAAVEAVKQWRYRPTLLNEQPVEVITQIDVNFTLSN